MGKSSAPSPMPDFAGIISAQAAANQTQLLGQLAQRQFDWAKQQWESDKATAQPVIDRLIRGMDQQYKYAEEQKKFYDEAYKPLEADFARKATEYDSPQRREQAAGEAGAEVAQQFAGAQAAAAQQLRDFGVDPSSPRYAATALVGKLGQAGATAGAQNMARKNVEMTGLGMMQNAINTGRGYAGAINQTFQTGNQSGQGGVNSALGVTQSGAQTMGTAPQYYGMQNQALGMWGNMNAQNDQNRLEGYKFANTQQSSGLGSALGLAGGILMSRFEEGGAVPDAASPTSGQAIDDVPARLTAGEFVMPKAAVEWFGEKHFHQLIDKASKERQQMHQQTGAVPDVGRATPEDPTFVSRSQPPAALPVG